MNEIPYNKAMTCKYQRIMELENTIEKEKTNNDKVCLCRSQFIPTDFLLNFKAHSNQGLPNEF